MHVISYVHVTVPFKKGEESDKKAFCEKLENLENLAQFCRKVCSCWCHSIAFSVGITLYSELVFRWIIQKAFFYPETVGDCGCSGITWRNFCLHCPNFCEPKITGIRYSQALTLDDLHDLTPSYIGCITSNQWRRTPSPREAHYELLTMSPRDITRLDRPQDEQELRGKLTPMDMYLSEVTATSASAINYHMGSMQGDEAAFKDLKVLLGLSVGASIVSDERHEKNRPTCLQVKNSFRNKIGLLYSEAA